MEAISDEDLARKLQKEYDKEANDIEMQSKKDALLAQKMASKSHNISDSESETEETTHTPPKPKMERNITESIPRSESISPDKSEQKRGVKRPICKFGSDCYRKNPWHLEEFYHPDKSTPDEKKAKQKQKNSEKSLSSPKPNVGCSDKNAYRLPFEVRLDKSNPYRFFLNKIYSLPETQKDEQTLVFPDLLNPKLGTIIESLQFNFMVDLEFVMSFYKSLGVDKTPVLFMYGQLEGNPRNYENVTCNKVDMPFQYGVHHSKMMVFHYKEGLRVVIHTANLIPDDWSEKTQGFWISPLFPSLGNDKHSLLDGESKTNFKRDFTDYILSYKTPDLIRWSHIIKGHDFSSCRVHFIGSVPGYHTGEKRLKFGHMKCRQLIRRSSKWKPRANSPVIVQCSSIGSLGKDSKSWLTGELGASLSGGNETTDSSVKVIYPSEDDVRNSSQGYGGGSCLPYNSKTHEKQPWLMNHFHCWRSKIRFRTRSMPHIKTYTRISPDMKEAQFFLLTSSNISKAAWGQMQKQGSQIFIRSYEVGVLWLPENILGRDSFPLTSDKDNLPLHYDLPLSPYSPKSIPWLMNTSKKDPDVLGTTYILS